MVAVKSGELGAAASLGEESLALYKKTGSRSGLSSAHIALARIAVLHGDPERAMELAREGLSYAIDSGDRRQLIEAVESVAQVLAVRAGAAGSAARLLAAAAAARQESNCSLSDCDKKDHELAVSRLLDTLSSSVFSSVWEQGRKMSLEQMVAFATAAAIAPAGPDADIRLPWVQ